jgi:hypothetical protein
VVFCSEGRVWLDKIVEFEGPGVGVLNEIGNGVGDRGVIVREGLTRCFRGMGSGGDMKGKYKGG